MRPFILLHLTIFKTIRVDFIGYQRKPLSHLLQALFVGITVKPVSGFRDGQARVRFVKLVGWGVRQGAKCIFVHLLLTGNIAILVEWRWSRMVYRGHIAMMTTPLGSQSYLNK